MAHGGNTQFEWLDGTPKWDDGRKKVWLKWKWYDPYFTGELTKYLDHFEIQIRYSFKNANGGIETQQKSPESMSDFRDGDYNFDYYWDVPADCLTVEFAIHAIAKTNSQNGGSVPYFEDDPWPAPPFYCGDATVPDKPSAPSVSHNAQIGTQVVLGLDNVRDGDNNQNVVQVEFQTVYYDTDPETELGEGIKVQRTEKAKVDEFGNARALVYIGNKYGYKFRARLCGVRDKDAAGEIERQIEVFSEWSELTDIVLGVPERPAITVRKYTDVVAEYQIKAKNPYDHYQIQSAQTIESFDEFDDWEREYPQFKENSDERTAALQNYGVNERSVESQNGWIRDLTTLEAGKAYWRVRSVTAQSDGFYSTWSEPFELTFGEKLRAPIVSMGSQFATLDDTSIQLIIRHNSPNGSPTCRCDIYLRVGAGSGNIPYFDTIRPEDMNVGQNNDGSYTYYYNLNLKDRRISLQKEDTITWYAYTFEGNRASESVETRSYQSEYVTFWVYETPSVELAILSQNGESMPLDEDGHYILPGFPIRLVTTSNLGEKKVVSWNIRIIPTISYYNTGRHGEREVVNAGSVLYNQIDVKTPTDLDKLILANEVSLDQGVVYILEVTAAINTGVTVSTTAEFKMVFTGAKASIECASSYNFDNISLGLCPSVWKEEGTGFNPDPVEPGPPILVSPTIEDDPTAGQVILHKYRNEFVYGVDDNGVPYSGIGLKRDTRDSEHGSFPYTFYVGLSGTLRLNQYDSQFYESEITSIFEERLGLDERSFLEYRKNNGISMIVTEASIIAYKTIEPPPGTRYSTFFCSYPSAFQLQPILTSNKQSEPELNVLYTNSITLDANGYIDGAVVAPLSKINEQGLLNDYEQLYSWTWMVFDYGRTVDRGELIGALCNVKIGLVQYDATADKYRLVEDQVIDWPVVEEPEPEPTTKDTWSVKTWRGLTSLDGKNIWTDGTNVYYSSLSSNYVLNKETSTWETKDWGSRNPLGSDVWTDGTNIYYSGFNTYPPDTSTHYVFDKETSTWSDKTWSGLTAFNGKNIWTDGTNVYYSNQTTHYVLNKSTSTWSVVTWNGLSSFDGRRVWTDGTNIYYSTGTSQYVLNRETSTWTGKRWNKTITEGYRIWTDGESVYYSGSTAQYVLNKELMQWEDKVWYGLTSFDGDDVWTDGNRIYYSSGSTNYILSKPEPEPTTAKVLDPNYTLSVYRKNDDGTFVTIAENLLNTEAAFVTDPHPNLGGSEYRIVATDMTSGQMIFYDPPPYDMQCTDIIIQWDEEYADIPFNDDSRETIRQFGSFVRLPYNIDVSESANMENSMVNYIGRKNPVSYYGTQTGYTANWNTEIPKYDTQTIKMLRRLQVYPGDVYVREPSGTGYWAHVTVSFPINHCALTVSVSLSVTRVEGGM